MKTEPKVTKEEVLSWCPEPRGEQDPGNHAEVPPMRYEDAKSKGKYDENRKLSQEIIATFKKAKPGNEKFVLQWRMFPKAIPNQAEDSCGCGCSCGCG